MSPDVPPSGPSGRTYRQVPSLDALTEDAFRTWFTGVYSALTGQSASGSDAEWHARYLRLRAAFQAALEKSRPA